MKKEAILISKNRTPKTHGSGGSTSLGRDTCPKAFAFRTPWPKVRIYSQALFSPALTETL